MEAGLATHFVPSEKLSQLEDTLHSLGPSARDPGSIGRAIASVQVGEEHKAHLSCQGRLAASLQAMRFIPTLTLVLHVSSCKLPPLLWELLFRRGFAWVQEDTPAPSGMLGELPAIDECFRHDRLEDIYKALHQRGDSWAKETLQTLSK